MRSDFQTDYRGMLSNPMPSASLYAGKLRLDIGDRGKEEELEALFGSVHAPSVTEQDIVGAVRAVRKEMYEERLAAQD